MIFQKLFHEMRKKYLGRVRLRSIRNNNWNNASKRLFGRYSHSGIPEFPIYGGLMVSALDSGPGLRVRALAGDIVLCSRARHFTLTVPLSTQVYKWVPANLMLGVTLRWTSIPSRGE